MTCYCIESRAKKYIKGFGFLSFLRNLSNEYKEQLLDTGLGTLKNCFQKIIGTGEFIGNKVGDKIVKPAANSRNVGE